VLTFVVTAVPSLPMISFCHHFSPLIIIVEVCRKELWCSLLHIQLIYPILLCWHCYCISQAPPAHAAWSLSSVLSSNSITFDGTDLITATTPVFSSGDVGKHITYKTMTGYESGRFEITDYIDASNVEVSILQEPTTNTYVDWYLSFSSLSGLGQFDGTTISAVADGGYLDDYDISAGTVDFETQVNNVVLGYRYKGIIKTFCLGFQIQGVNTQTTMKAISRADVRCVASAGLEVGSSLYKLEPVQDLSPNDLNYLPPIPIDGTKAVTYSDDNESDKYLYVVQDLPLPAVITSVMLTAQYAVTP